MPRIKAVTDAMIEKSQTIRGRADAILDSQKSVSGIASGMGQNFSGKMPSLILRNVLSMRGKYTEINENLTEYSGFLEHAANEYEWTEAELTKLMQSIGTPAADDGTPGTPPGNGGGGNGGNGGGGDDDDGDKDGKGDDDEDEEDDNGGDGKGKGGGKHRRRPGHRRGDKNPENPPKDGTPTDPDPEPEPEPTPDPEPSVTPAPTEPDPIAPGAQIPNNPIYNIYINLGQSQSYAVGRAQELSGVTINWYGGSPNTQDLLGSASNLTQTDTPSVGSIIQWLFGGLGGSSVGGSGLGNVGVVEGVNPIYDSSGAVSDYDVLYSTANQGSYSSGSAATVSSSKLSDLQGLGAIFLQLFFQLLFGGSSGGSSAV
jgi:surface antigen